MPSVQNWFAKHRVEVMEWPTQSSDLNSHTTCIFGNRGVDSAAGSDDRRRPRVEMCIYRNITIEDHRFLQFVLNWLAVFEIPLHTLGAYIVMWKTPKVMLPVKPSMLLLHFTCVWHDMCLCVLVVPFIIFQAGAGFSLGILLKIGVTMPYIIYIGVTTTFLLAPAVVFFFEDRYNTLVRRDSNTRSRKIKRIVYFTINYLLMLVALIPTLSNVPDQKEAKALTLRQFPCLPPDILDTPGQGMSVNFFGFVQIAFFFGATALKVFNMKTASKRTSEMQKHLFKCLCLQVATPILIIVIPCSYVIVLSAISYLDQAVNNIVCILLTVYGALSTISMLTVHKPYRLATLQLFRFRSSTAPTSLFVNSLS
uniref:G protein-coupled receptor n=1 Tax=Caenorhabditis japonica TaxID=281687 RepID=A0A8R1IBZ6_CAEJA